MIVIKLAMSGISSSSYALQSCMALFKLIENQACAFIIKIKQNLEMNLT